MRFTLAARFLILYAASAVSAQPVPGQRVENVTFRGARRVPQETLRGLIDTRSGEVYSEDTVKRDVAKLRDTGRFDDIRVQAGVTGTGVIVTFVVAEKPAMRGQQPPDKSQPTVEEILDRFK